jgi:hypothetical protein
VIQSLPKDEKERSLDENKDKIKRTLDAVGSAAPQVTQAFPQIKDVAEQARNAGATDIADKAQQILKNNATQSSEPAAQAAAKNALKSPFYLITPTTLTDEALAELQQQVLRKFLSLHFQSSVHPSRKMDNGVEVVYYRTGDEAQARELLSFVVEYLSNRGIHVQSSSSKETTEKSIEPSQFDLHLGPDVADALVKQSSPASAANSASTGADITGLPKKARKKRSTVRATR